jgi:hypothetical protein
MTTLVCFLEEASAREFLKGVLSRLLNDGISVKYVVFEGKQDLEKQIVKKMRNWQEPDSAFLVMRDQDAANCTTVKENLVRLCNEAHKPSALVRIACHELESFYFGNLSAVEEALQVSLNSYKSKAAYRIPDNIVNPSKALEKITGGTYQKIGGSRDIGKVLPLADNSSHSFNALISGIQRLCECNDAPKI